MRNLWIGVASLVLITAACTTDPHQTVPSPSPSPTTDGPAASSSTASLSPTTTAPEDAILTEALTCDPLDERACLLPWPNDAFTMPDPSTPTGRRLAIEADSPPANAAGTPIDVTDANRADGFSPGSAMLTLVPRLDLAASGIAPSTDIGASLRDDSPIVLIDTTTGQRLAHWAELDAQAPTDDDRLLMIHPASALPEGHHVIVALRNLRDADGDVIAPTEAFLAALDGTPEPLERARALREMLAALADDGIDVGDLYLAWEFTVASEESLSGRLLSMRDQAYTLLGDAAPEFTVTAQTDEGPVRTIDGEFEVPSFLTGDGGPGSTITLGDHGLPILARNQPMTAAFRCVVPLVAPGPVPTIVYGHGLLGHRSEVDALAFAAAAGQAAACATDWIGMSNDDIGNLVAILGDLSRFNQQADRMLQGHLNMLFLGRAINDAAGFVSSPAFQRADGLPLLAPGETVFVGNSQGGILGGATSAVSTEWSRVVLGVPGSNYSLLLPRSSDWPQFQTIFDAAYTDPVDRQLALQLIQLLWDRGENNGYVQHLTNDPYDGVAAKDVLMIAAFGDHQVANVATDVLARTIGAAVYRPTLATGRSADREPQWNLPAIDVEGSASRDSVAGGYLVVWDYGTPPPPPVNRPPTSPEYGNDPHGAGSREARVLQQAFAFLLEGRFEDVCAGEPCVGAPA
jgi:hypothetical protein